MTPGETWVSMVQVFAGPFLPSAGLAAGSTGASSGTSGNRLQGMQTMVQDYSARSGEQTGRTQGREGAAKCCTGRSGRLGEYVSCPCFLLSPLFHEGGQIFN